MNDCFITITTGLLRRDGKRPDGATLIPSTKGKSMAWDVIVPDFSRIK